MPNRIKLIIATKNQHKVKEFERILSPMGIDAISQVEAGINIDVEETADTFEGNARLKAIAVSKVSGLPTIADDSGLEVYCLNNAPGIYSARYGGDKCKNDIDRYKMLLSEISATASEDRGARFVCSISLVLNGGKEYTFTGFCEGEIGYKAVGENGFGYDPIFMVGDRSFSQFSGEEKDKISHRGIALRKLQEKLAEIKEEILNDNK